MKPRLLSAILIAVLLAALLPAWTRVGAQETPSRYFDETGHTVSGEFLIQYLSVPEPEKIYGYPITDAFTEASGRLVQYFQKARFVLDPSKPANEQFDQTPLGKLVYDAIGPGKPVEIPANFPACEYFDEVGLSVCYEFYDFFEQNGGLAQFGYPVSAVELYANRYVQYFQYARMEFHHEYPAGEKVRVADLGRVYFDLLKEDSNRLRPVQPGSFVVGENLRLTVRAFTTRDPLDTGNRLLYVIVQDQNRSAIQGATVSFRVLYPDGTEQPRVISATTNQFGFTSAVFPLLSDEPGIAQIIVSAAYAGLQQETRTSFRIWY